MDDENNNAEIFNSTENIHWVKWKYGCLDVHLPVHSLVYVQFLLVGGRAAWRRIELKYGIAKTICMVSNLLDETPSHKRDIKDVAFSGSPLHCKYRSTMTLHPPLSSDLLSQIYGLKQNLNIIYARWVCRLQSFSITKINMPNFGCRQREKQLVE